MEKEMIAKLFQKFEEACYLYNNMECWSARDLQEILGYTEWRNFLKVIEKAKIACENTGVSVSMTAIIIDQWLKSDHRNAISPI
jgi:DNA-damage-inducible protein D